MKQKQEIIFYSILALIGIIAIIIVINIDNKKEEVKTDNVNDVASNNVVIEKDSKEEDILTTNKEDEKEKKEEEVIVKEKIPKQQQEEVVVKQEEQEQYSQKDLLVINELNSLDNQTDLLLKEGTNETIGDKAKGIFITLVDFCFYDGKINGITFDELTEEGKSKVLKIVNKIDEKIENKFPGYKEKISSKTSEAFKKASEIIKKGANNVKEFAKEKLGDRNYQSLIDEKDELVLYTKNAWSLVKDFSSSIYHKTTDSLKKWYENFKNKNK